MGRARIDVAEVLGQCRATDGRGSDPLAIARHHREPRAGAIARVVWHDDPVDDDLEHALRRFRQWIRYRIPSVEAAGKLDRSRKGIRSGVEEAGVVHAKLADQRIERHHLGRIVGRHLHGFLRGQDVELVGIEDQPPLTPRLYRLPEIGDRIGAGPVHIS